MLKEKEVLEKGIQALKECLILIPFLEIVSLEKNTWEPDQDFLLKIRTENMDQSILIEVKTLGTPKSIRGAVNSLKNNLQGNPSSYGIVIAPYISPKSAEICVGSGIGYLDLSGNCRIAFQEVFINRENFPNKYPYKSDISSLYSPKSERILRVLLTYPYRFWKTLELAKEAQISPGMITHVRKKLNEEEWIESTPVGFRLIEPAKLLQDWAKNYSFQKNTILDFYSLKPLPEVEKEIAQVCDSLNICYALTSFSASSRLAPMVRNQRVMAYVEQGVERLIEKISIKPVNSGANVSILSPYDEGVFWNSMEIKGIKLATPIQVYLDLINYRGRGEEAADFLYKEVIQESWQHQKSNTIKSL